jgi:hypothetical protein
MPTVDEVIEWIVFRLGVLWSTLHKEGTVDHAKAWFRAVLQHEAVQLPVNELQERYRPALHVVDRTFGEAHESAPGVPVLL